MKAKLEYNLPEDRYDLSCALKGVALRSVMIDILDYLRGKLKYEEMSDEVYNTYEEVQSKVYELLSDRLSFDVRDEE